MKKEKYLDQFVSKERNKEFRYLSLILLIKCTIITIIVQV